MISVKHDMKTLPILIIIIIVITCAIALSWWLSNQGVFSKIEKIPEKAQQTADLFKAKEPLFTFAVLGDNEGVNQVFLQTLKKINQSEPDLVIHVGDFVPRGAEEDFIAVTKEMESLTMTYYPTVGNNDLNKEKSPALYQKYFTEDLYYSFDYQNSHFVILDNSNRLVGFDQAQLDWLDQDLDAADKENTFLFFHRPVNVPLESFFGDDETPASRKSNGDFLKILDKHNITRIFCGHVHLYFSYNLITPSNKKIPVTITGGAGAKPQSILGGESSASYHYVLINVFEDGEIRQSVEKIE